MAKKNFDELLKETKNESDTSKKSFEDILKESGYKTTTTTSKTTPNKTQTSIKPSTTVSPQEWAESKKTKTSIPSKATIKPTQTEALNKLGYVNNNPAVKPQNEYYKTKDSDASSLRLDSKYVARNEDTVTPEFGKTSDIRETMSKIDENEKNNIVTKNYTKDDLQTYVWNKTVKEYKGLDDDVIALLDEVNAEEKAKEDMGIATASQMLGGQSAVSAYTERAMAREKSNVAKAKLAEMGYNKDEIKYLSNYRRQITNAETAQGVSEVIRGETKEHPVLGTALSFATNLASPMGMVETAKAKINGVPVDPNSRFFGATQMTSDIRGQVMEDNDWNIKINDKEHDAFDFLYGAGTSTVDSIIAGTVMPNLGINAKSANIVVKALTKAANGILGGAMIGSQAATSTIQDVAKRGGTTNEAINAGVVSFLAETLSEAWSIGNFKSLQESGKKGLWNLAKDLLKSAGVNASEEAVTEAVNLVYDRYALGDKSNFELNVKAYMQTQKPDGSFYTREEAEEMAWHDAVMQVAETAASGAFQGVMMGGTANVTGRVFNYAEDFKAGKDIRKEGVTDAVVEAARTSEDKIVQEYVQRINKKGKENASNADIGAVAREMLSNEKTATPALETISSYSRSITLKSEEKVQITHPTLSKADGKVVSLSSVESVKDGTITVKDSEGATQTLDVNSLEGRAKDLWSYASKHFNDAQAVTNFINSYDGQNIDVYSRNYKAVFDLASVGMTAQQIVKEDIIEYHTLGEKAFDAAIKSGYTAMSYKQGVVDLTTRPKTKSQEFTMKMADEFGKRHGMNITFIDTLGSREGFLTPGKNQIVIALDSSKGAISRTLGHETYHYVEVESPQQAKEISEFVIDTLTRLKGEKWVNDMYAFYEKNGYDTLEAQKSELVADQMFEVFANERAVNEFVAKDRTFAQEVLDHIKGLIAEIKNIYKKLVATGNYEDIAAWQEDLDALQKVNDMMLDALSNIEQRKNAGQKTEKNTSDEVVNSVSRNPAQTKYENDVDAVINGTYNSDSALIMGVTPKIYQDLGFNKLPIAITKNHVYSIAVTEQQAKADGRYNKNVNYHGLGVQAVKDIYQNISDPIMIIVSPDFQSKTQRESVHKVIAVVDLQVGGKQVIAPIEIDAEVENNNFKRIDVNLVSSYFDKSNLNKMLSEAVAQESTGDVGFYYVDKNRAKSIFKKSKVQYLSRLDSLNSNGIIHKIDEKVNRKIDSVLKSKQFIRWFGDWQNKPETASKIVNADGTPKVMYHGTLNDFTVFDKKKAKSSGYYGKGFYFTDSESHAQQYGNSMAVYLDVKNPLEQGKNHISKKQLRNFLEAVAENEDDYDIWNYGTEDIDEIINNIYKDDAFAVIQDVNATAIGDLAEAIDLFNKVNKTNYDGVITPTETVVYKPTQIKSATDNIGTFDKENPDIRYSTKREASISEDASDYILDTKEYQQIINIVNQRYNLTNKKTLSSKAIDRLASKLLANSKSKYDKGALTERLSALFDYMANSNELVWEDVMKTAAEIAHDILSKSSTLDRSMQAQYKDTLDYIKGLTIYISPEVRAEIDGRYGSLENYRRMLGGKMKITVTDSSKVSLDSLWRELNEYHPEMFDAETNSLDQAEELMNFFDITKPRYVNQFEYYWDMNEASYDFALQIYEEYFNIPEVQNLSRKHQLEMERLKGKQNAQIAQIRKEYKDRMKRLRSEKNSKIEATKELYRERNRQYRDKRNETAERQKLRRQIIRETKKLTDMLVNPTDKKHIPQELIVGINSFANAMTNHGAFSAQKAARLQRAFKNIGEKADDPDFNLASMYDESIDEMLDNLSSVLSDKRLGEMTVIELSQIKDIAKYFSHIVSMSNKAFSENIRENLSTLQTETLNEVESQNKDKKRMMTKMQVGLLKPVTFFEIVESPTLEKLYTNIRKGEESWARTVLEAKQKRIDTQEKYGYKEWADNKVDITTERGDKLSISVKEALSIYATSKREQGVDHIMKGGIVLEEEARKQLEKKNRFKKNKDKSVNVRSANIPLSLTDIQNINMMLTSEQKAYADELVRYMSSDMAKLGNEVSMKLYGIQKYNEGYYFPLKSANNFLYSEPGVENDSRIKHMSMTKRTVPKANNPVVIGDFTETAMSHCNDMALYYGFTLSLEDFKRVWNYKTPVVEGETPSSIKQQLDMVYGDKANKYIKQMLTDVNGGVTKQAGADVVNKMIGLIKKNSVFASLSVAVQQPSALARAFAYVDPKYFTGHHKKGTWEEIKKYAPVAVVKEMGYFDTGIGRQAVDWMTETDYEGIKEKALALIKDGNYRDDKLSKLPSFMDEITWGRIWIAVKNETKAKNPDLDVNSREFLETCGERFTYVIDRTQVYDSVFSRSEWMRSKDTGVKVATAFMSEPLTNYNLLYSAAIKGSNGNKKFAVRAAAAYLISVVFNSILKSFVTSLRDDDEEKSYWEKYIANLISGITDEPFGMIPYFNDVVSLIQGYSSERMDTQVLADSVNAISTLFDPEKAPRDKVKAIVNTVGLITGLPFKNVNRDVVALYNGAMKIINGNFEPTTGKGIGYAISEKYDSKKFKQYKTPTTVKQYVYAYLDGDKAHLEKTRNNLMVKYKNDEKKVDSEIKTALGELYKDGDITKEQAEQILKDEYNFDKDELYWQFDKWDGGTDYSKYGEFYDAVESGKNIRVAVKHYTDNGVEKSDLASLITTRYKDQYIELYKTNRSEASKLKTKLVEAYAALGYKRADKSKDIDEWLKPKKVK